MTSAKVSTKQDGVSLVEVVVSMFMLTVLVVLYAVTLNMMTLSRKQRYEDIAYHIANSQMETLRTTAFASLPGSGSISNPLLANIPSGSGDFAISNYLGYSGMKEMIVTVNWNDGVAHQVILQTLAGSGGINP